MDGFDQTYSYHWSTKIFFYLFSISLALLNLLLVIQLGLKVVNWLRDGVVDGSSIVGLTIGLLIFGFCFALFSNAYPNIKANEKGLKVQVFLFGWYFVPWANIEDIWTVGIFRKRYGVVVQNLTPVHRVIGLGYGSLHPVFPIAQTMSGYNELLQLIKRNIQKPNRFGMQ